MYVKLPRFLRQMVECTASASVGGLAAILRSWAGMLQGVLLQASAIHCRIASHQDVGNYLSTNIGQTECESLAMRDYSPTVLQHEDKLL